jgi:hypothetical protein
MRLWKLALLVLVAGCATSRPSASDQNVPLAARVHHRPSPVVPSEGTTGPILNASGLSAAIRLYQQQSRSTELQAEHAFAADYQDRRFEVDATVADVFVNIAGEVVVDARVDGGPQVLCTVTPGPSIDSLAKGTRVQATGTLQEYYLDHLRARCDVTRGKPSVG